ncbi:F-box/kelch-repeat protein SKIP25-like [Cornus florida]|uniref:F-box/kelch-repeat protein SKIP25-like n=1 Tax=Cornus florida TaxID=4283 RepID=UPI002898B299|nr:F-box/kelch-repeat protein SKIP25-like [Cornus florida]
MANRKRPSMALDNSTSTTTTTPIDTTPKHCKSKNFSDIDQKHQPKDSNNESVLLPGLPNHLAQLCLSSLHPSLLSSVCSSWRRLIYSPSFPPFFSLYALLSPSSSSITRNKDQDQSNSIEFFALDPISSMWRQLPSPPPDPPLRLLLRHPSFISRNLPIQSLTVNNYLVLVAATTHGFLPALSCPLVFDPVSGQWFSGPPLSTPRRWCITGSVNGTVYIASGVGTHYQGDVGRSLLKWDMKKNNDEWNWENMATLKDGRFSREAVEAVGYRGKLYMVNVKGNAVKQGAVYDVEMDRWEEMPERMVTGWNGPAAVMDGEDVMYVVDEAKGVLSKYDFDINCWEKVMEFPEHLKGAEQIAAGRGRVCVVCANNQKIVVVDVVARPVKLWVVDLLPEMEVVAVHIMPRMSRPEY